MAKIDTREWKEFRVGDLFLLERGKCSKTTDLPEGTIPYVGCTNVNNGVMAYYSVPKEKITKGHCICFIGNGNGSAGQQIYRADDFLCSSGNVCGYMDGLTPYIAHFIVSVMDAQQKATKEFSHSNGRTLEKLSNQTILLPATSENLPDYAYMEEYMRRLEDSVSSSLTALQSAQKSEKKKIDVSEWGDFVFGELFQMQKQKEISPLDAYFKNTNTPPLYPFYGQSSENNGVINYISLQDKALLNNPDGDVAIMIHSNNHLSFVISSPFYLKDGHGATSIFKNKNINIYSARYIITVLNKTMDEHFDYSMKATKEQLNRLHIKLPITDNGTPDWEYMESYMRKIETKTNKAINNIKIGAPQ